jgi:capsular exopolysaccharide synthesis family protein
MTRVAEALRQAARFDEQPGKQFTPPPDEEGEFSPPLLSYRSESLASVDAAPAQAASVAASSVPAASVAASSVHAASSAVHLASSSVQAASVAVSSVPADTKLRRALGPRLASRSFDSKLVASAEAASATVQEYRQVAAALQEIQNRSAWAGRVSLERSLRAVLVTSALPGEGKTLTVANLALTLSDYLAKRVLVIDADFRRPALHELLALSNGTGLSEVLRSATNQLQLQQISPLLSVLPAGQVAADLPTLGTERMRLVLEECTRRFDWVLLDTPAISTGADARLLAGLCRAVLLVIASGATSYRVVERAISEVGRGCVIGALLNQVTRA